MSLLLPSALKQHLSFPGAVTAVGFSGAGGGEEWGHQSAPVSDHDLWRSLSPRAHPPQIRSKQHHAVNTGPRCPGSAGTASGQSSAGSSAQAAAITTATARSPRRWKPSSLFQGETKYDVTDSSQPHRKVGTGPHAPFQRSKCGHPCVPEFHCPGILPALTWRENATRPSKEWKIPKRVHGWKGRPSALSH